MKLLKLLILILFSSSSVALSTEATNDTIFIGVNVNYTMPLVEIKNPLFNPEIESGILKDLAEAITQELKLKPVWLLLPKNRVAPSLLSGDVAMVCHLNEVWQPKIKKDVYWSQELYTSTNVIVHHGKKPINKASDLYGERVGTVMNFIYQNLDNEFAKKKIIREDGPNNEANIRKLKYGRINYIVMSNLEFDYYKKIYPTLESADLKMDSVETKCALSKKAPITLQQLNRAIDTIKKNGTFQKILKAYQN
ncbi:substrate-binding periplasmic protein [Bdellovibrio sp. HCB337]|uniref:substrate-binding periplasmic protein n=1 Tax=Bdellovibrio sp. HCB337 TaxID=3394358 RepID=UPI0039A77D7A